MASLPILFLIFVWALVRRSFVIVACIAFIFPLMYSVSIILLAPSILYVIAAMIFGGRDALNQEAPLFLTAFLATVLGIAVHPAPIDYLYNGTWLNLGVFLHVGRIIEASELSAPALTLYEWTWIIVLLGAVASYVYYIYRHRTIVPMSLKDVVSAYADDIPCTPVSA